VPLNFWNDFVNDPTNSKANAIEAREIEKGEIFSSEFPHSIELISFLR
jgi:hypothetical protein